MKKILFALVLFFIPTLTLAASTVSVAGPNPIFAETNIAPGYEVSKTITVTNNSSTNQQFKFQATATNSSSLKDVIFLKISSTTRTMYNGTLANLYNVGEVNLDALAPSVPTDYTFNARFDENAGNEYMGKSETFDLTIGFAATPTTNPATTGGTSNPAGPLAALAGALGFTPTTVTTTDNPAVAGAETKKDDSDVKGDDTGEVRGSSDKTCPWWWIVALILAIALAFVGGVLRAVREDNFIRKYYLVWPAAFGVVAWVAHYFLHKGYQATWFCNNYWLVILLEVMIAYVFYQLLLSQKKKQERIK